jgi:CO/xanthine dehydrogenase FAD-binding subunit
MKPAPFTYHRPTTRDEVDELLAAAGGEARILAGGQSLVPLLNMRLVWPDHVIDINGLEGEPDEPEASDGWLVIGPLVRQSALEESPTVARVAPLLVEAIRHVGHPAIRNRGTVLGSAAHADPAAEVPPALVLLGTEAVLSGKRGRRTVRADELFVGVLETCLAADEWLVELRVPVRERPLQGAVEEFARRHGDFALCGVAATAEPSNGACRVELAFFGMAGAPRSIELGSFASDTPDSDLTTAVREVGVSGLEPPDDIHATSDYRRHLAERLGVRAARRALERALAPGEAS